MEEVRKRIYLDSANTTYVNREVLAEMMPTFNSVFGDPTASYSYGRDAKHLVDIARMRVARAINAERDEIYFTNKILKSNFNDPSWSEEAVLGFIPGAFGVPVFGKRFTSSNETKFVSL